MNIRFKIRSSPFFSALRLCTLYFVLCTLFFIPPASSQTYNFLNYSVDDGLPFIQVSTIFQDSKGYLWTGGYGGLSRFDGKNFVNYAPKDGLADHSVTCITEDNKGHLMVGTINGLSEFDGKKFRNYTTKDKLPDNSITAIAKDLEGNIWVGTPQGIAMYDGRGFKVYTTADGLNSNSILCIFCDKEGRLWFGTEKGLSEYDHGKIKPGLRLFNSVNFGLEKRNRINGICEDNGGRLWLATADGLTIHENGGYEQLRTEGGEQDNNMKAVVCDEGNNLWIATGKGLLRWDNVFIKNNRKMLYSISENINSNLVGSLFIDFEGNLWIGTFAGIYKHRDDAFISFTQKDGLTTPFVYPILRGRHHNLWVGTNQGGLFRYADGKFTSFTTKDGLPGNTVNASALDKDSNIWIGTDRGLSRLIENNGRISFENYYKKDGLLSDSVTYILQDQSGLFWLGGHEGVTTFDPKTKKFTRFPFPGPKKNYDVWFILEDSKHTIWFGTYLGGLYHCDPANGCVIKYFNAEKSEFQSSSAFGIAEDGRGNLYFGTLEGVWRYAPSAPAGKQFTQFSEANGLSSDLVYSILLDDGGNTLWVGTNQGLNKINLQEFHKSGRKLIEPYGKEEGFLGVECNSAGIFRDADSTIWFGTVNGLIRYDPKEFRMNNKEARTNITGTRIFYTDTLLAQGAELNWYDNNISFEFIGICLTNPAKVRYTFILEGADKNWSPETKNTIARYSNLPPGTYTFRVKSRNNEGVWNSEPVSFTFTVLTPWWKSWWFRILLSISVVTGVYVAVRLRVRQVKMKEHNKVLLANNELKALRAQMNPHFIFNALNSIQHFIMSSDESGASKYLNKFAKLIRSILNNTEKSSVSLRDEVESLKLYIELEMLRFEHKFDYVINVPKNTDLDFYEVPTLLIQPYVENAIIHGLVPKERDGHLVIDISIENNFIVCVITDNGIGRKSSAERKANSVKKGHKSLGMKITRDRLELLNSVHNSSLSVNISDLTDASGAATGTKVEIYIPIV